MRTFTALTKNLVSLTILYHITELGISDINYMPLQKTAMGVE